MYFIKIIDLKNLFLDTKNINVASVESEICVFAYFDHHIGRHLEYLKRDKVERYFFRILDPKNLILDTKIAVVASIEREIYPF